MIAESTLLKRLQYAAARYPVVSCSKLGMQSSVDYKDNHKILTLALELIVKHRIGLTLFVDGWFTLWGTVLVPSSVTLFGSGPGVWPGSEWAWLGGLMGNASRLIWHEDAPRDIPMMRLCGVGSTISNLHLQGVRRTGAVNSYTSDTLCDALIQFDGDISDGRGVPTGKNLIHQASFEMANRAILFSDKPHGQHADECNLDGIYLHNCETGIEWDNAQSVGHSLRHIVSYGNRFTSPVIFDVKQGGKFHADGVTMNHRGTVLRVGDVGSNCNRIEITNLVADNNTAPLRLYDLSACKAPFDLVMSGHLGNSVKRRSPELMPSSGIHRVETDLTNS